MINGVGNVDGHRVLLLGVVYAKKELTSNCQTGQMYRDRIRCEAMTKLGYDVFTLDDKHSPEQAEDGTHCQGNFSDVRRLHKAITTTWSDLDRGCNFDLIILDYFFCPEGYVASRWTKPFFSETLPFLAASKILKLGGQIILPNLDHVQNMMQSNRGLLKPYFDWERVAAEKNPLFVATESIDEILVTLKDGRTNASQMLPLFKVSNIPFFVLHHGPRYIRQPSQDSRECSAARRTDRVEDAQLLVDLDCDHLKRKDRSEVGESVDTLADDADSEGDDNNNEEEGAKKPIEQGDLVSPKHMSASVSSGLIALTSFGRDEDDSSSPSTGDDGGSGDSDTYDPPNKVKRRR